MKIGYLQGRESPDIWCQTDLDSVCLTGVLFACCRQGRGGGVEMAASHVCKSKGDIASKRGVAFTWLYMLAPMWGLCQNSGLVSADIVYLCFKVAFKGFSLKGTETFGSYFCWAGRQVEAGPKVGASFSARIAAANIYLLCHHYCHHQQAHLYDIMLLNLD